MSVQETGWPTEFQDPSSPWFWWWRDERLKLRVWGPEWNKKTPSQRGRALGVFRYELARRHNRNKRSQPYPQADPFTRDLLAEIVWERPPIVLETKKRPYGKARYIDLPHVAFWAGAARGTILEHLGKLIDKECSKQGVQLPRGPVRKRNVPPSWKWVELLDRKYVYGEKLTDEGERASLTQARRAAEEFALALRERLIEELPYL